MEVVTNNWFSNKYSIGYALSGGFIKGFAHLGAMQALLEHDIKPDIISGNTTRMNEWTGPQPKSWAAS